MLAVSRCRLVVRKPRRRVDLVKRVAYTFKGVKGEEVEETDVPSSLSDEVEERRNVR